MSSTLFKIIISLCVIGTSIHAGDTSSVYKGENDFYKGSYAKPGDYILNGGLIKDLPAPIKVPVHYKAPGFDGSLLSKVPAPGIHPRIIISPSDVERFKEVYKMGKKAPRIFRVQMEQMRRDAESWKVPKSFDYRTSTWGEDSKIAGWALYALITDNKELGRQAAEATVEHALYMEGRIDILHSLKEAEPIKDVAFDFIRTGIKFGQVDYHSAYHQGGAKRVAELLKKHGAAIAKKDISGAYLSLAFEYDYAHPFMTEQERTIVRRVISKSTYGKYTSGMQVPGHMYINNHMSGAANQTYLALAIEGEEGYDPRVAKMAEWSLANKLSYDLSSDGITYENNKGFIPMLPVLAIARRQGADHPENLLKHSHLLARANSNLQNSRKIYYRYYVGSRRRPDSKSVDQIITGLDEARYWIASGGSGTGGHLEFWSVLKHFYPKNKMVDFVWNCKVPGSVRYYEGVPEDKWGGKIHYSWFGLKALNLLTATHMTDFSKQNELSMFKDVQPFWFDRERGITAARNDWSADGMVFHLENRIDQFYMGHESPQHGDFQVWADGIQWIPNGGGYLDTSFRNMVTVDGLASVYAPISGDSMTATNYPEAANSVSEMTTAYQWRKSWNGLRYLDHPGLKTAPYQMGGSFLNSAWQLNRFSEFAYLSKIREHYDGFANLDHGPWHGETRGPEYYIKWNDAMKHVFRTTHLARGKQPYLLIFDDLKKADNENHQFDWRMMITGDAVIHNVTTKVKERHLEMGTEGVIGTDIVFAMLDTNYKRIGGRAGYIDRKANPKKGDPMLLVRVLWRNTNFPYPVPNVQRSGAYFMVSVPAFGKSPEYRIMVFPHRFGDKLPSTEWSDDRSRLTVKAGGNVDVYDFGQTEKERTIYTMARNGKKVMDSVARPPVPQLIDRPKFTVDQNRPNWRPAAVISQSTQVAFATGQLGSQIHYTLDGNEPGIKSPVYSKPLTIDKSCTVKARTYHADWRFGKDNWSETASFEFEKQEPLPAIAEAGPEAGLLFKGYEIKTTEFDKKAFFQGSKNSLPNLKDYKALLSTAVSDFTIPQMDGAFPAELMCKAFYQFQGYVNVAEAGVYSFEVESCGPIELKLGEKSILLVNQQFGLSYKKRYGEIALAKGKHKLELVTCDPVFWKGDKEKPYTINVSVLAPGSRTYKGITSSNLSRDNDDVKMLTTKKDASKLLPASTVTVLPGLIQNRYDRVDFLIGDGPIPSGKSESKFIPDDGISPTYFDLKKTKPYVASIVDVLERNDSPRKLVEYLGYIRIPKDGVYEFKLKEGRENAGQLLIDNHVVVRRQIDAPKTDGKIALAQGLHAFKLQLAMGQPLISMKHVDDSNFQYVTPSALAYDKNYRLPEIKKAAGGGIPTAGLIAHLTCDKINGETTPVTNGDTAVALVEGAEVIDDGVKGKALGFYGPGPISGLKFRGLKQREDAFTISCWIKFRDRPEDIMVWGQAYGDVSFRLRGNSPWVDWARGIGAIRTSVDRKLVAPGQWFHVAATYGKENALYFNGKLITTAQSLNFSGGRSGNGFFADHDAIGCNNKPTAFDEYRLYDRVLSKEEIKTIYDAEKK